MIDNKECCCNCKYQKKIQKHPWNTNDMFKGSIGDFLGWACTAMLKDTGKIIFFEKRHGLCELHDFDYGEKIDVPL
jgi:hypothetical protein